MPPAQTVDAGFGISCIDAQYIRPGLACFYLVERGGECAVIETGTVHSVPLLQALLTERGIAPEQVRYVIPTHVHLDHAGGAGAMLALFPQARLLVHPRGARHLVDPERLVSASMLVYGEETFQRLYGEIVPAPAARVEEVADGAEYRLGDGSLLIRHTPGHADHHFCVWDEVSRGWFSGDMFGISYAAMRTPGGDFVMPATTPTQFRPQEYVRSLDLIAAREPQRIFLTHFGELSFSAQAHRMLLQQIERYVTLAETHHADPERLESAIIDYSLHLLNALNPGQDQSHLVPALRHDANLNAQGLVAWHQREKQ